MVKMYPKFFWLMTVAVMAAAQVNLPPVVNPRGAANEFSRLPAPAAVTPGGQLRLTGLNLGPVEGFQAKSFPLPTEIGTPPTQVMINNRPAPILSATPDSIVCQVPWETPAGAAVAIVRRGEQSSRAVRFNVRPMAPALRSQSKNGFGTVAGVTGSALAGTASGLGMTEPRPVTGSPAEPGATPVQPVLLFADGLAMGLTVTASGEVPGEFTLKAELPNGIEAGDLLQLVVQGNAANPLPVAAGRRAQVSAVPLPAELVDPRAIQISDLRGGMGVLAGPRGEDGCYPAWSFDMRRGGLRKEEGCLTAVNRAALTPVLSFPNSPVVASFLGPGEAAGQLTSYGKVRVWNPAWEAAKDFELPATVVNLVLTGDGDLRAVWPAEGRSYRIDLEGGTVSEEPAPENPVNPAPGQGAAANLIRTGQLDTGDGVKYVLAALAVQGGVAVVVADSDTAPTKARIAVVDPQGQIAGTRDYMEGWLPLAAPAPPTRPGQQPAQPVVRLAGAAYYDAATRTLYVLSRSADKQRDGIAGFPLEGAPRLVNLPEGWSFAACSAEMRVFDLELTRRIALFGSLAPSS